MGPIKPKDVSRDQSSNLSKNQEGKDLNLVELHAESFSNNPSFAN